MHARFELRLSIECRVTRVLLYVAVCRGVDDPELDERFPECVVIGSEVPKGLTAPCDRLDPRSVRVDAPELQPVVNVAQGRVLSGFLPRIRFGAIAGEDDHRGDVPARVFG